MGENNKNNKNNNNNENNNNENINNENNNNNIAKHSPMDNSSRGKAWFSIQGIPQYETTLPDDSKVMLLIKSCFQWSPINEKNKRDLQESFISKVEVLMVLVSADQLRSSIIEDLRASWQLTPLFLSKQNLNLKMILFLLFVNFSPFPDHWDGLDPSVCFEEIPFFERKSILLLLSRTQSTSNPPKSFWIF